MATENTRAVEKFHLLFLTQLGARVDKKLYALKGGCNLRFFWKSIRYSEDIDFDVHTIARETLRKNVNQIFDASGFRQILRSVKMEIARRSEPKQTDTTQRWKVHLRIEGSAPEMPTRIEFSRRKFDKGILFEPIDPDVARSHDLRLVLASHYGLEAAVAQKIDALASRAQTQARDLFDVAWLTERGGQELEFRGDKKKVEAACENAMSVSFDQFKSQVVAYLQPEYQEYYGTQKAWNSLQENVLRILGGL
ncbi:MAG TPA: nucleotidyl transferase AbiEii/AbiGii toxin family protein [Candidatus Udaeobacter sp.]|nr:nucleotidyl transferase AbiEii/AbiGii toxin family protein [Candidatus Udaeobacter sp.]